MQVFESLNWQGEIGGGIFKSHGNLDILTFLVTKKNVIGKAFSPTGLGICTVQISLAMWY